MVRSQFRAKRMTDSLAISVTEAARRLGVSRSQAYVMVKQELIPIARHGKRILVLADELPAALKALRVTQRVTRG